MNISLLFRKHSPLTDDGLPWLDAGQLHPYPARRNPVGEARLSAILVRALLASLDGNILEARCEREQVAAWVKSRTTSGSAWCLWQDGNFYIPHGSAEKITYHVGVLALIRAICRPDGARDLLEAYLDLQVKFSSGGWRAELVPELVKAADELYYFLRFGASAPRDENDQLVEAEVSTPESRPLAVETWPLVNLRPLTSPEELRKLLKLDLPSPSVLAPASTQPENPSPKPVQGFIGPQAAVLAEALQSSENVLLAGPTGSGKTLCFQQVTRQLDLKVITIEGKEGLLDLDFLGAILPKANGSRGWVDGPLSRAMRLAWEEQILLFIDEINRIPQKQINLLLTVLNPKTGDYCCRSGIAVDPCGLYYVLEIPMTAEILICPTANLRFVIAGNFGRLYSVYNLDPALRRRFETVIEFDYLEASQEMALLKARVPDLPEKIAQALVNLAQETRRMLANGELPGCVDTGSLVHWAVKCSRRSSQTIAAIMRDASITWADLVCGRDHMGRINQGNFKALQDYLKSLGTLPAEEKR